MNSIENDHNFLLLRSRVDEMSRDISRLRLDVADAFSMLRELTDVCERMNETLRRIGIFIGEIELERNQRK